MKVTKQTLTIAKKSMFDLIYIFAIIISNTKMPAATPAYNFQLLSCFTLFFTAKNKKNGTPIINRRVIISDKTHPPASRNL